MIELISSALICMRAAPWAMACGYARVRMDRRRSSCPRTVPSYTRLPKRISSPLITPGSTWTAKSTWLRGRSQTDPASRTGLSRIAVQPPSGPLVSNRLAVVGSCWQAHSREAHRNTKAQCCQAVRPVSIRATPGFDDPAAQHPVSLVKDRRLPRAEGPLRRIKLDAHAPARQRPDRGRSRRARVADLDLGAYPICQSIHAQQVEIADEAGGLQQIFLRTYHDGITRCVHAHDVEALCCREPKPASLARSIERHSAMHAQHRPIRAS